MNTTTDKMPCEALEAARHEIDAKQDKKDWAEYSQLIAARQKEHVVGNYLQDRERIGY